MNDSQPADTESQNQNDFWCDPVPETGLWRIERIPVVFASNVTGSSDEVAIVRPRVFPPGYLDLDTCKTIRRHYAARSEERTGVVARIKAGAMLTYLRAVSG